MIDISNDGLLNNNNNKKNNMLLFDSISEKQDESSNSSNKNSKIMISKQKVKNNNKSLLKSNDISKDGINTSNISITNQKIHLPKKSIPSKKIINENFMEDERERYKKFVRAEAKKKTSQFFTKRTSFQRKNFDLFYNQLKNNEERKRNSSSKNIDLPINALNKTILKDKKSLNATMNHNKTSLSGIYNKHSIIGHTSVKNKSVNLTNSDVLDMKYFANKKMKNTVLHRGKLNFKEQKDMHSSHLFEKLKESYLFEKSEALLFKIKICYGFLAVFSFISILLETIDVIVFNKKSEEYLDEKFNISIINITNIDNYYLIEKREISKQENTIRIFNSIFSILCFFLHLIIHHIKNNFDKQSKKKMKKKNFYNYNYNRRKTTKYTKEDIKNNLNENRIKIVINDDFVTKNYVTREEVVKLIINCIISIVFFPPKINKVFIGVQHQIIYVYSLNSICLLITFFKLINIYFAFYYLSPFNNLLYKTICSSNMVKMDFKFMFRFLLNLYPIIFIIINFIIITLVICILLYIIEYFSININDGIWNSKGENDLNNFYNDIFLYCSFVLKSIHGNLKTQTELGSFILIIGGTIGLVIISYLIYYINQLIEFKPEEQQAYSKLIKLLNPINNEHKASNLIKIFLLMKKMYIDNINIENEYKLKKENNFKIMFQKNFGYRNSKFNFGLNESINSLSNYAENNEYKEKKKFLKFIGGRFVLKSKLINECKNFKNNLLIARNNSLSFNDVLKTLGDKMNGNINQLNAKLEVLIQNDQKYRSFMKFQENSVRKIIKLMEYQNYTLNYLLEINNEISIGYLSENKEMQNKFLNKYKNAQHGGGIRRLKSTFNGPFFNFGKKISMKKNMDDEEEKKSKKKQNSKGFFKNENKGCKRLRSSIVGSKSNLNNKMDFTRSKTNPIKKLINKNKKRSYSLNDNMLKICEKRNKINNIESNIINELRRKIRSLSGKKKIVIDKWKKKFEK